MRLQSFVVGSDEIELSLGRDDGGKEYFFARLPLPEEEFSHRSLNEVRLLTLCRVRQALSSEIERLSERVPSSV
jgi:hypothetical protein